jgi:hypothetical protein
MGVGLVSRFIGSLPASNLPLHFTFHYHTNSIVHSHIFTSHCMVVISKADVPLLLGSKTFPVLLELQQPHCFTDFTDHYSLVIAWW